MSDLSGIISLFFIAAAFLTSCDQVKQPEGVYEFPALHLSE